MQGIGDLTLAYQSFRLALASNNDHAEAYNNLGVLEMKKGRLEMVSERASIVAAISRFPLSVTSVLPSGFQFGASHVRTSLQLCFNV